MRGKPLVILLLGCLVWLAPALPHPSEVLFWRGGAFSDLLISHWPNAEFIKRSLLEWGQIPLWNPTILSGAPFFADPLSGLWYPPLWLASWLTPGIAFNLLTYLHLVWAGLGTWRLVRRLGLGDPAASLAGLSFSGMPKLIGHVGLGHLTLVFAVCWTPWELLAVDSAARRLAAGARLRLRSAAVAGGAAGLVFLIDPRWFAYILLLGIPYAVWTAAHSHAEVERSGRRPPVRQQLGPENLAATVPEAWGGLGRPEALENLALAKPQAGSGLARPGEEAAASGAGAAAGAAAAAAAAGAADRRAWSSRTAWARGLGSLAVGALASVGVAAGLALPLAEFLRLSTRAGLSFAEAAAFSLPLDNLPNLLAPDLAAWPEWQTYSGVIVLLLASAGLIFDWRRTAFWGAAAAFSLLLALGTGSPLYSLLRGLVPGFAQLRVPPRSLFISGFAICILAAYGLQRILSGGLSSKALLRLAAVIAAATVLSGWITSGRGTAGARLTVWVPHLVSLGLIGLAVSWASRSRQGGSRAWAGWLVLVLLDFGVVNFVTLEVRPGAGSADPRVQAVAESVGQRPPPRFFSPSYSLPQPSSAAFGLETADGVNPLQLASYDEFMSVATGISSTGYSVTLPRYPEGGPQVNRPARLDAEKLGLLSISEVLTAYPVEAVGFDQESRLGGLYRYSNPAVRPRAWIETSDAPGWRRIQTEEWTPNHIQIGAAGPGRLVLSELTYPGWRVEIDGKPAVLQSFSGLFRAVDLPPGAHEVEFTLRPASLIAGLGVSLISLVSLASLWIRR